MSYREAIPLVVLTGFLGSGKTTLLNAWLRDTRLRNCAVLINEFGEIGLDHQLVEPMDGSPVLLANGCVCCSIREDLKTAILNLDARRLAGDIPAFTRLVIETTGVADPAPILATLLNDPELRHHYRLGTVVTVVDARHGPQDLRLREEALKQAAINSLSPSAIWSPPPPSPPSSSSCERSIPARSLPRRATPGCW